MNIKNQFHVNPWKLLLCTWKFKTTKKQDDETTQTQILHQFPLHSPTHMAITPKDSCCWGKYQMNMRQITSQPPGNVPVAVFTIFFYCHFVLLHNFFTNKFFQGCSDLHLLHCKEDDSWHENLSAKHKGKSCHHYHLLSTCTLWKYHPKVLWHDQKVFCNYAIAYNSGIKCFVIQSK